MFVHTFGAYFGLAVSWAMTRPAKGAAAAARNGSDRNSDMFAMVSACSAAPASLDPGLFSTPSQNRTEQNSEL